MKANYPKPSEAPPKLMKKILADPKDNRKPMFKCKMVECKPLDAGKVPVFVITHKSLIIRELLKN
jgi:hypothetical protein